LRVHVRYFASLRERRGLSEEWVEVSPGETLGALYTRLFPPVGGLVLPVAYARNQEYASAEELPSEGDEITFLPPIGGG
jgi:molybdopterin synthase sulfur carrier subunit